ARRAAAERRRAHRATDDRALQARSGAEVPPYRGSNGEPGLRVRALLARGERDGPALDERTFVLEPAGAADRQHVHRAFRRRGDAAEAGSAAGRGTPLAAAAPSHPGRARVMAEQTQVLALDLGTSGAKAAVFAPSGRVLATAFQAVPLRLLPGGG